MTDPRATNPILYDGDMRILEVRADHPALADTVVLFGGKRVPLAHLVGIIANEWHTEGLSVAQALQDCADLRAEVARLSPPPPLPLAEAIKLAKWHWVDKNNQFELKTRRADGAVLIATIKKTWSEQGQGRYEWHVLDGNVRGVEHWEWDAKMAVRRVLRKGATHAT